MSEPEEAAMSDRCSQICLCTIIYFLLLKFCDLFFFIYFFPAPIQHPGR